MKNHRDISNDRSRKPRKRKRIVLIALEGKNKTEKNYLDNFKGSKKSYNIKYAPGNDTDPLSLVKKLINEAKTLGFQRGDVAFCVFDTDTDPNKNEIISKAIQLARKHHIKIITSAPCFELWFLLHHEYTTKLMGNEHVLSRLRKYYPKYEKNFNIYPEIEKYLDKAIEHAIKLEKYQLRNGRNIGTVEANPNTEFYKIVEYLKSLEENDTISLGQVRV